VDQSALRVLKPKALKAAQQHIGTDETVHVCLATGGEQALIALDDRLLIVKAGYMAGRAFGAKVTSFNYAQIIGIETNVGFATGFLQVQVANAPGVAPGSYWSQGAKESPWKLANCIPIPNKKSLAQWEPHLQTIRAMITKAKEEPPSAPATSQASPSGEDLASSLERIKAMHESGALSDEEFAQAKAKLLG
jgi:hypothetical protein